jgi:hypothetical protein
VLVLAADGTAARLSESLVWWWAWHEATPWQNWTIRGLAALGALALLYLFLGAYREPSSEDRRAESGISDVESPLHEDMGVVGRLFGIGSFVVFGGFMVVCLALITPALPIGGVLVVVMLLVAPFYWLGERFPVEDMDSAEPSDTSKALDNEAIARELGHVLGDERVPPPR